MLELPAGNQRALAQGLVCILFGAFAATLGYAAQAGTIDALPAGRGAGQFSLSFAVGTGGLHNLRNDGVFSVTDVTPAEPDGYACISLRDKTGYARFLGMVDSRGQPDALPSRKFCVLSIPENIPAICDDHVFALKTIADSIFQVRVAGIMTQAGAEPDYVRGSAANTGTVPLVMGMNIAVPAASGLILSGGTLRSVESRHLDARTLATLTLSGDSPEDQVPQGSAR